MPSHGVFSYAFSLRLGANEEPSVTLHERDFFGLRLLRASHPQIRRLKRKLACSHQGQKLWRSTSVLLDYLQEYPLDKGCRVLDVGAGWGMAGLFCAQRFNAAVTALDIDPQVFAYLELHAAINNQHIGTRVMPMEALTAADLAAFDVVIASDICFWDSATQAFQYLVETCLTASKRLIVSDPGRPPFIDVVEGFIDLAQQPGQTALQQLALENWSVPPPLNSHGLIFDTGAPYVEF
jgi:predicted nicotinamide N-methyase